MRKKVMTEAEWLTSRAPRPMLAALRDLGNKRKYRLFACACLRSVWHLLDDEGRKAVEVAERVAAGRATEAERSQAYAAAAEYNERTAGTGSPLPVTLAWVLTRHGDVDWLGAEIVSHNVRCAARGLAARHARFLHDIFGNPFRPAALDPACLAWQGGTVPKLAQSIFEDRAFHRLPILGDALEEAGCTDAAVLSHCRERGEHVPGCWVVDIARPLSGRGRSR